MRYEIVIEKAEHNYCAYVPNLPVCITTAYTRDGILSNMQEAMTGHLESMCEDGDPLPPFTTTIRVIEAEVPASFAWSAHTLRYVVTVEPHEHFGFTAYVFDLDWNVGGCDTIEATIERVLEMIQHHVKWCVEVDEELVMPTTTVATVEVSVPQSLAPAPPAAISATS